MTSMVARSKVDLHLANCRELIRLAGIGDHTALTSSAVLQFEMAIGFYLIELLQTGRNNIMPWPVSGEGLIALANQFDVADLNELCTLCQEDESWLSRMLRRLALLRRCDTTRTIKAEIFQSDLEAPNTNQMIATSREDIGPGMDSSCIAKDLDAFAALLSRQRLGHEEY